LDDFENNYRIAGSDLLERSEPKNTNFPALIE
jgi:hypothetical protein